MMMFSTDVGVLGVSILWIPIVWFIVHYIHKEYGWREEYLYGAVKAVLKAKSHLCEPQDFLMRMHEFFIV